LVILLNIYQLILSPSTYTQGIFLVTRLIHDSALHRYWCITSREAHMIFADDSACLMADNVWNEGK
jgi:hypothetical protein